MTRKPTARAPLASIAHLPLQPKRILFLGDSITHAGQYVTYIETYFRTRAANEELEFLNLALPSETTSGLSEPSHAFGAFPRPVLNERLGRVLEMTNPNLVFACYGMNDGIYQALNTERFEAFKIGMRKMHDAIVEHGSEIIHITPPYFDGRIAGNLPYESTLEHYSQWLIAQRAGWSVIDLHGPLKRTIAQRLQTDSRFCYADDGIHPGDQGHWMIAKEILLALGAGDLAHTDSPLQMVRTIQHGENILKLIQQRGEMLRDSWLTTTRHKRPEMNQGIPLAEAEPKATKTKEKLQLWLSEESQDRCDALEKRGSTAL